MTQQPATVRRAVQMLAVLVGLAGVTTVMAAVLREDLLAVWAAGQPADSTIKEPALVEVAVVLFVVFAGLVWVLVPFLRAGANWARYALVCIVALVGIATLAGLRTDPPAPFVVAAVLSLLVDAALLVLLCHPATSAHVHRRDRPLPTAG